MKFFVALFFLLSLSKSINGQSYDIRIKLEGMTDSVAYMGYHFGEKKYLFDTSVVSPKGEVRFFGEKEIKPGIYFLYGKSTYIEFIVDETNFTLTASKDALYESMKVMGSRSNEAFRDFQIKMISHQKSVRDLTSQLDSTSTAKDSVKVKKEIGELNEQNKKIREALMQQNSNNLVGMLLNLMELSPAMTFSSEDLSAEQRRQEYNDFRKGYFDKIDFGSLAVLRTPIFHNRLIEYVENVTVQHPDSVISSIDDLLVKAQGNEELYRYIMVVMFQKYQNPKIMGMDKVFVHLSDEYYLQGKASWADSAMIAELKDEMKFHRENQIGMPAPYMALVDTLDRPVRLYHVQSDYTILYFYSPTCGHCKKKTPVLKKVYDHIKSKGVEVVAVCTDTEIDKWKDFIKELDLDWLNYADPHLRSNFRVQYNVRSTPVLYILDKDKKIIAKKLDVEQVEGFINDQIRLVEKSK